MINILQDSRWHTAKDLRRWIPDLDDRTARQIAERHAARIIGGNKGYRLIGYCSLDELEQAENRLRSQARRMLRRVLDIRKARAASVRLRG